MSQYEKAEAIVKIIADLHQAVLNLAPVDSGEKLISLAILIECFKAEMFKILATPMPKYPKGADQPSGAFVSEKEVDEIFDYLNQPKKKTWQERFEEMKGNQNKPT